MAWQTWINPEGHRKLFNEDSLELLKLILGHDILKLGPVVLVEVLAPELDLFLLPLVPFVNFQLPTVDSIKSVGSLPFQLVLVFSVDTLLGEVLILLKLMLGTLWLASPLVSVLHLFIYLFLQVSEYGTKNKFVFILIKLLKKLVCNINK